MNKEHQAETGERIPARVQHRFKIKGYPSHEIIFDYEDEIFVVLHDGVQIGTCVTHSAAKQIVIESAEDARRNGGAQ
jgi:hypothetical protein